MRTIYIETALTSEEIERRFFSVSNANYSDEIFDHLKFIFLRKRLNFVKKDNWILTWERTMWTGVLYYVISLSIIETENLRRLECVFRLNPVAKYFIVLLYVLLFAGLLASSFRIVEAFVFGFLIMILFLLLIRHSRKEANNFLTEMMKKGI
jgi:uncharacterized MnhB-related membrane protein